MQALKDAATLTVLILLALTVRIDIDGAPLDFELTPPADAAEYLLPTDEQPLSDPLPDTGVEPAPAIGWQGDRLATVPIPTPSPDHRRIERRLVWESNGYTLEIVLDGDEASLPSQPTPIRSKPCIGLLDPRFSS